MPANQACNMAQIYTSREPTMTLSLLKIRYPVLRTGNGDLLQKKNSCSSDV